MSNLVGGAQKDVLRVAFDRRVTMQFCGSVVTSDVGLLAYRLDAAFLSRLLPDERAGGESYAPDDVEALSTLAQGVGASLNALTTNSSSTDAVLTLTDAIYALREDIARPMPSTEATS